MWRLLTDPELPGLTHPDIEAGGAVKIDVLGDRGIFVVLQRVTTMVPEDTFFEAHRDHLDVHVPLEGAESIGYTPLDERLVPGGPVPVFQGDDVTYAAFPSDDDMSVVRLVEGMYALFGPDDVHMPKLQTDGPSPLRKVVVKVPVAAAAPTRRASAGRGSPGRLGAADAARPFVALGGVGSGADAASAGIVLRPSDSRCPCCGERLPDPVDFDPVHQIENIVGVPTDELHCHFLYPRFQQPVQHDPAT